MKRFRILILNEFKLARSTLAIHLVSLLQPTIMYILMAFILVNPTFDMYINQPYSPESRQLIDAMKHIGSPIGLPYINPIPTNIENPGEIRQLVFVGKGAQGVTAIQHFGLLDSNMVKNYRNRLTSAALYLWNQDLGSQGVTINEHPLLPEDIPYTVYFGVAMLTLTAFLSSAFIASILTTLEFEHNTILEYRLATAQVGLILAAKIIRLIITALIASLIQFLAVYAITGFFPTAPALVFLILIPVSLVGSSLGISTGLLFRQTIPSFVICLAVTFASWLLGSGFGLAAGFNPLFEAISKLTPNTHAVELIFPLYYHVGVGKPLTQIFSLVVFSTLALGAIVIFYFKNVQKQG
jgi:hypothetical protein